MSKETNNIPTPRMTVAGFTAIQKPTWDFNKTSKEYQIKVAIDADEAEQFLADMNELVDAEYKRVLKEKPKLKKVLKKTDIGEVEYDDDGEETGRILFKFKQKAVIEFTNKQGEKDTFEKKVALFDSRGKLIKKPVRIGTGSIVIVSFEPNPYFTEKDKEVGMSFNRLAGVQLIKLVEYEGGGSASADDMGFGAVDDDDAFDADEYVADEGDDTAGDNSEEPEIKDF